MLNHPHPGTTLHTLRTVTPPIAAGTLDSYTQSLKPDIFTLRPPIVGN